MNATGAGLAASFGEKQDAADHFRRHWRYDQTRSAAHTAMMRRRRFKMMVVALFMGADIGPRPFSVKS
jgi:hypothetical protein